MVAVPSGTSQAAAFNVALEHAGGEFICVLEAGTSIHPDRTARQIETLSSEAVGQIVGTYVAAEERSLEQAYNQPRRLNLADTWCFDDRLFAASTMVSSSVFRTIGGLDPGMHFRCWHEFWARSLGAGSRFVLLPEKLTVCRLVPDQGPDQFERFLEASHVMAARVAPMLRGRRLLPTLASMTDWHIFHPELPRLNHSQKMRLLAALAGLRKFAAFADYRSWLMDSEAETSEEDVGTCVFALASCSQSQALAAEATSWARELEHAKSTWFIPQIERLEKAVADAEQVKRDWFVPRVKHLEHELLEAQSAATSAREQILVLEAELASARSRKRRLFQFSR